MGYLTQAMAYHGFWAVWRSEFWTIAQLQGWLYFQLRSALAALPVLIPGQKTIARRGRRNSRQ